MTARPGIVDGMEAEPAHSPGSRTEQGRFAPGTSGNPGGRPRRVIEARAVLDEYRDPDVVRRTMAKLQAMALDGDIGAMKLFLDRVLGPVRRDEDDFADLLREAPDEVVRWMAKNLGAR